MTLGQRFNQAIQTYLSRPSDILPFYLLGLAIPAVARALPLATIGLIVGVLWTTGRFEELTATLGDDEPIAIDDPEGAIGIDQTDELIDILGDPLVVGPIALSVIGMILLLLVLDAVIDAGQLHGVYAAAEQRPGIQAGVKGTFRDAKTFIGLLGLEIIGYVGLVVIAVIGIGTLVAISPALGILGAVVGGLGVIVLAIVLRLIVAFARVIAVIENNNATTALRWAVRYLRVHPGDVIGYGGVVIALLGITVVVGGLFEVLGAFVFASLLYLLIVVPVLDLLKTSLYGRRSSGAALAEPNVSNDASGPMTRLWSGISRGWQDLVVFSREQIGLVGLSTVLFAGAGYAGFAIGGTFEGVLEASIERRLEDASPIGDTFFYFGNNWQVAVAQGFAGLGFGIPTVLSLVSNGLWIGLLYQLEVAPDVLLAFIIPHGLFEVPGLLLSGALGLYLGLVSFQYVNSDAEQALLVNAIERAYSILLGLIVLFALAAVIEAVISPYYWQLLNLV